MVWPLCTATSAERLRLAMMGQSPSLTRCVPAMFWIFSSIFMTTKPFSLMRGVTLTVMPTLFISTSSS